MKRLLAFALLITVLAACNGQPAGSKPAGATGPGNGAMSAPTEDNIGDLEQAVLIEASVAQRSEAPNIESTPLVDPTNRMSMLTIDVAPPYPEELWLNIKIKSRRSFPKNPGVLRIAIKDGDQVLDTFASVIGKTSTPTVTEHQVNALAARDTIPETMLVTIEVEALLMPEGTDPDTIDPTTAEVPESRYSRATQTPPVRINFEGAGQEAPAPATPDEGTAEMGEAAGTTPAAEGS